MMANLRLNVAPVIGTTVAALLLACALPARAAFIQLTQDRILAASTSAQSMGAGPAPDNQRETSSALGSFDRALYSSSAAQAPPPNQGSSGGTASASQYAHYNPTAVNARMDLDVHAFHSGGSSTAGSETNWRTTFRVDTPTEFHLSGRVFLRDFGNLGTAGFNSWSFFFSGRPDAGGETVTFFGDGGGGPFVGADRPLDIRGMLQPGHVYTLGGLLTAGKSTEGGVGLDKRVTGFIDANLFFVPEPSGAAVLALAAGAAVLPRRRRRAV
jgi:hypothetical protein